MSRDINKTLASEYTYCSKCKKYYSNKEFETVEREEIKTECTFCDGDDYEYSNVRYIVTYKVCPTCNEKIKVGERKQDIVSSYSGNYYK